MALEEGEIVLCTVDKIERTAVFVTIDNLNQIGSITMTEVSPGRIRNIRDFVVPKKKIVCKVLHIKGDHVDLSLRRVSQKERKEIMDEFKREKTYRGIVKGLIGEEGEKIIEEICKDHNLCDFLEEAKKNPKKIEKIAGKENAQKIIDTLNKQKPKILSVKKEFVLKTKRSDGLTTIKKILDGKGDINYISAGRYVIKTDGEDKKAADQSLQKVLERIAEEAKKEDCEFHAKEK